MNIAIVGYGKMGREIERTAHERKHKTPLIIDINNLADFNPENLRKVDVVVEFTSPSTVVGNILTCFKAGIPIVTGSTGWSNDQKKISDLCIEKKQALFFTSNFSIGVNILFSVNEYLASLMNKFSQYDVSIEEIHHTQKIDAPSGTAISLANQIISRLERKKNWELNKASISDVLKINAIREGEVSGIHEILYESEDDLISLKHIAKSRKAFAQGAVLAAEFIKDKKGVYSMRDLMGL